jgi:hypothetical protein
MSVLFALALAVAPAPYDDGAEGCMAYGVYTEHVTLNGDLTYTVPTPPDSYEVTAVVLGDQSTPVQHSIIAPATSGQTVTSDVYLSHIHICYTQLPSEDLWPDTTSTTTAPSSTPLTSSSSTTAGPAPVAPATSGPSTSSPTTNSTTTTVRSATSVKPSSVATSDTLPATGVGSLAPYAAALVLAGAALLRVSRRA